MRNGIPLAGIEIASVIFCALVAAQAPGGKSEPSKPRKGIVEEYCRRARAIDPLNPQAYVELGLWCRENGLDAEARDAFRTALLIDPDHATARRELGFVRRGLDWVKADASRRDQPQGRPPAPAKEQAVQPESGESGGSEKATGSASPPVAAERRAGAGGESKPEAAPLDPSEAALLRKKAWAEKAFASLMTSYVTYEDEDFLVHTTYPSLRQREVRELIARLRALRQELGRFLGYRSRTTRFWPDKLQFVLLRYEEEFRRFAELADGIEYARVPGAAYVEGDHMVLWRPDSEDVPRWVGETALENLDGSDRYVGWWLRAGLGEMLAARSIGEGSERAKYNRLYRIAAQAVRSAQDELKIYSVLETREAPKGRERERRSALAFTLVDFFSKLNPAAFRRFVRELKSERAPEPPRERSGEEFRRFHLQYILFQQNTLESLFRVDLSALDARWKDYVLKQGGGSGGATRPGRGRD